MAADHPPGQRRWPAGAHLGDRPLHRFRQRHAGHARAPGGRPLQRDLAEGSETRRARRRCQPDRAAGGPLVRRGAGVVPPGGSARPGRGPAASGSELQQREPGDVAGYRVGSVDVADRDRHPVRRPRSTAGGETVPARRRGPHPAGALPTGGELFRRRVEGPFERIVRFGTDTTSYHFEVTSKDGTNFVYGRACPFRVSNGQDPGSCLRRYPKGWTIPSTSSAGTSNR